MSCHYWRVKTTRRVDSHSRTTTIHTAMTAQPLARKYLAALRPDRSSPESLLGGGQATPTLDAPVATWGRVCFHTPRSRLGRSRLSNALLSDCHYLSTHTRPSLDAPRVAPSELATFRLGDPPPPPRLDNCSVRAWRSKSGGGRAGHDRCLRNTCSPFLRTGQSSGAHDSMRAHSSRPPILRG